MPYEIVQTARGWALRFPILGRFARWAGYIDVDSDGDRILAKAKVILNEKASIVFFPEGTRSTDGTLGPFHGAAFRIAIETETPIVPVIITGIADKPAKGSFIMHPGVIDIKCMEIIKPEAFKNKTPFVLKKEIKIQMGNHASMAKIENKRGDSPCLQAK